MRGFGDPPDVSGIITRFERFGMPVWKLAVLVVLAALALAGCRADDPQAALDAAAESLQRSIEERDTRVM